MQRCVWKASGGAKKQRRMVREPGGQEPGEAAAKVTGSKNFKMKRRVNSTGYSVRQIDDDGVNATAFAELLLMVWYFP